jgi:chemotaxis protein methyltransferase CheR
VLETEVIPALVRQNKKELKIWSAACSTGDEPYTIVMIMKELFPHVRFNITATDLDDLVIDFAKSGLYPEKSLANLPKQYIEKYFKAAPDHTYQLSKDVINHVRFKQHNLLADSYDNSYDLIVCRNVLIYFTEEAKLEVFKKFQQALRPNGYLFIGSTEQILQARSIGFEPQHSFFYRKNS